MTHGMSTAAGRMPHSVGAATATVSGYFSPVPVVIQGCAAFAVVPALAAGLAVVALAE